MSTIEGREIEINDTRRDEFQREEVTLGVAAC